MRPIYQSLLTLLAVCCGLALFFVFRWFDAAGAFTTLAPVSPGTCRVLASLPGPGDFEIDAAHKLLLVASSDRRHPAPRDGIYAVPLSGGAPFRLAGPPKDFHPTGISIARVANGDQTLFAVDRKSSGLQTVDSFSISYDGATPKLVPQLAVAGGLLVSPNDLFALAPTQFYVANDHVSKTAFGRFAEFDLLWAHSDLLFFNGNYLKIAVQRIAGPDGVLVSPDGRFLYIAAAAERRLIAFSREPFIGDLTEIGSLSLPARPGSLSTDASGNLIVSANPSLLKTQAFEVDPGKPSPSAVFRVHLDKDGVPQRYDTLYANDGQEIGAASSAAVWNGHLIIGSALDNKILECPVK